MTRRLPGAAVAVLMVTAGAAQTTASFAERREHWSWQPLLDSPPPATADAGWVRDPLDAFVLARLQDEGLQPAADAPPEVWLRRVWFDVVGLPPPVAAVRQFVADPSAAARERVVDALLASPHYGERWARHWLDLVRYAESLGHEFDFRIPNAWRYRDYVVRAINDDLPFDQFAREQIAGDLLPAPRVDPATGRNESVHGTAFWWFAEQTHSPVDAGKHQADRIDNQLDVLTKAFLGTTVACARCHDHKFDAIRSADYYALYGFLKSSRYVQQPTHWTSPAAATEALASHRALAELAPREAVWLDPMLPPLRDDEVILADFDRQDDGWFRTGDAFGERPWRGPFVEATDGATVRLREFAGGWANSAARGVGRSGVLHSPSFPIEQRYLHLEVAGQEARALVIVDGLHVVRDPIYGELRREVRDPHPHWLTFDLQMWRGQRAHVQLLDQRTPDLADPHRGDDYAADAWLAVRRVVASPHARAPAARSPHRLSELWATAPRPRAALARFRSAVAALPPSETLPGMADGSGEDEGVFLRGSHKTPTAPVGRRFLEAVAGAEPMAIPRGSGRLALAEAMFADDDPLPARVLVNRVWHHLFGRGLVQTVDNLGHLGSPPTHPLLLDRLALDLRADGWSTRRLLRRILLSRTYAMHSRGAAAADERDPDNRLLHRQNLRRLEGEAVRDALLSIADRLDPTLGGPPITVYLEGVPKARGRPDKSGPLDGAGRRSIYLSVFRNFLPEFLLAFDLPTPFATVGARNVSNVPAQSLALLNDPFVMAMCESAARHLIDGPIAEPRRRIEHWFLAAFARLPSEQEIHACLQVLAALCSDGDAESWRPWADLAHALVNKKEFVFLR